MYAMLRSRAQVTRMPQIVFFTGQSHLKQDRTVPREECLSTSGRIRTLMCNLPSPAQRKTPTMVCWALSTVYNLALPVIKKSSAGNTNPSITYLVKNFACRNLAKISVADPVRGPVFFFTPVSVTVSA